MFIPDSHVRCYTFVVTAGVASGLCRRLKKSVTGFSVLFCTVPVWYKSIFFSTLSPRGAHSQSVGVQVRSWQPPAPEMAPHCFLGSTSVQTQRPAAPVERLECAALERHEFAVD